MDFFRWEIFLQDTGGGETYLHWLMTAWGWTLAVSFWAWIIAMIAGIAVGTLRTTPIRIFQILGGAWTEFFRNIPLLVQIFIWYHVLPSLFKSLQQVPSFALVVFGLGFFTSARIAEQVKSGIDSLTRGQMQAALAMGLTRFQAYRYVLLPQAFRIVIPPLTGESMNIIKNSAAAFAVSISELTMFALQAGEETSRNIEIFFATTTLYFISAYAVNQAGRWMEHRLRLAGSVGGPR